MPVGRPLAKPSGCGTGQSLFESHSGAWRSPVHVTTSRDPAARLKPTSSYPTPVTEFVAVQVADCAPILTTSPDLVASSPPRTPGGVAPPPMWQA